MSEHENEKTPITEKELSSEERQEILQSTAVWLRKIIDEKHDPEFHDIATFASATNTETREANQTTYLTIYDFIDQYAIELSGHDSGPVSLSTSHFYLGQKAGGIWQLQTTGDLSDVDNDSIAIDAANAATVYEHNLKEPLYPNSLRDASDPEIVSFHELVELGTFGDTPFDFEALDSFRADIDAMKNDADDIEKNNP